MEAHLQNILSKLIQVRDLLTEKAVPSLRKLADYLALIEEAARRVAGFVDNYGTSQVIPPGAGASFDGGLDSDECKRLLAELQELKAFAEAEQSKLSAPQAFGPITDWLGKIDPGTKKAVWGFITNLITQVLLKGGIAAVVAQQGGDSVPAAAGKPAAKAKP